MWCFTLLKCNQGNVKLADIDGVLLKFLESLVIVLKSSVRMFNIYMKTAQIFDSYEKSEKEK